MNILFDQGVPVPLRAFLSAHEVTTAHEAGWATVNNGELLKAAERNRYAVLVTTDQNLEYQQNLRERKIAVMVLCSTSWPRMIGSMPSRPNKLFDDGLFRHDQRSPCLSGNGLRNTFGVGFHGDMGT